jgi:hypothetical protein
MDEHRCSEMETIIKVHRQRIDELETTLDEINKQLAHIKGGVYGICLYAVATQLGILEAIKL